MTAIVLLLTRDRRDVSDWGEEPDGHEATVGAASEHNDHRLLTPTGAMSQVTNVRTLG